MARRYNEKDIKRFLKEQGLTSTYRLWKRHKPSVRRRIPIYSSDFKGGKTRRELVLTKERGKTVIRDGRSYRRIREYKKPIPKVIDLINRRIYNKRDFKIREWDITDKSSSRVIDPGNVSISYRYNKAKGQETRIVSSRSIKMKRAGWVTVVAKYWRMDGFSVIVERNSSIRFLNTKQKREAAIKEAVELGAVVAGFSPVAVDILDYYFNYGYTKRL